MGTMAASKEITAKEERARIIDLTKKIQATVRTGTKTTKQKNKLINMQT